jgi:hypothetical protein
MHQQIIIWILRILCAIFDREDVSETRCILPVLKYNEEKVFSQVHPSERAISNKLDSSLKGSHMI